MQEQITGTNSNLEWEYWECDIKNKNIIQELHKKKILKREHKMSFIYWNP